MTKLEFQLLIKSLPEEKRREALWKVLMRLRERRRRDQMETPRLARRRRRKRRK